MRSELCSKVRIAMPSTPFKGAQRNKDRRALVGDGLLSALMPPYRAIPGE